MPRVVRVLLAMTLMAVLALSTGCQRPLIETIRIMHVPPPGQQPEPATYWQGGGAHPTAVQDFFSIGDELILGLVINLGHNSVTFTKYTYFNTITHREQPVDYKPADLGPFQPAQQYIGPWPVPGERGIYELRVYLSEKIVASAIFVV